MLDMTKEPEKEFSLCCTIYIKIETIITDILVTFLLFKENAS